MNIEQQKKALAKLEGSYCHPEVNVISIPTMKKPTFIKRVIVKWLLGLEWKPNKNKK